jgi:hypothetical protein
MRSDAAGMPKLVVMAEGQLATGERWILKAGGTDRDYYTFLTTVYPDGQSDEGGFGGPALYDDSALNTYTGVGIRGLPWVLARTNPKVQRLRVELTDGHHCDLAPTARDTMMGLTLFAVLLQPNAVASTLIGLDAGGRELGRQRCRGW